MKSSSKFDIVVYGATGFTGQLVVEYLAANYKADSGLKWAMAGRSLDKLKSVRDEVGAPADTPLIAADSSDLDSLKAMVDQANSVIAGVGPYQYYGTDLLAMCAETGTDYLDYCGEPIWMRQMIDAYDAKARASGARILFSCGFDSLPFELGTFFVQKEAKRVFGAPASRVKGRVRDMRGTLSGGTAASAKGSFRIVMRLRSLATASNVALALAAVPPESVPRMSRTRPLTRETDAPNTRLASVWTKNAPSSNGSESKPHENKIRAPLAFACSPCASIICRIQIGSPQ